MICSTTKFALTKTTGGAVVTKVCPGIKYTVKVTFGSLREALITTTVGSWLPAAASCPGRIASTPGKSVHTLTLSVPCKVTGTVQLKTTSAINSGGAYKQATFSIAIDPTCKASSCPAVADAPLDAAAAAAAGASP